MYERTVFPYKNTKCQSEETLMASLEEATCLVMSVWKRERLFPNECYIAMEAWRWSLQAVESINLEWFMLYMDTVKLYTGQAFGIADKMPASHVRVLPCFSLQKWQFYTLEGNKMAQGVVLLMPSLLAHLKKKKKSMHRRQHSSQTKCYGILQKGDKWWKEITLFGSQRGGWLGRQSHSVLVT